MGEVCLYPIGGTLKDPDLSLARNSELIFLGKERKQSFQLDDLCLSIRRGFNPYKTLSPCHITNNRAEQNHVQILSSADTKISTSTPSSTVFTSDDSPQLP